MTIGMCINFCLELQDINNRYAGVEYSNECWCGIEGAQYDQYGRRDESDCSMPCVGNPSQTCGGFFRIEVHDCKF